MIESTFRVDKLQIRIFENRAEMGKHASKDFADHFLQQKKKKNLLRMVFAAAPSQNEFLKYLILRQDLAWENVLAFHMDEYIGLPVSDPRLFRKYLDDHVFNRLNFKRINYLDPFLRTPEEECIRYATLLREAPVDMIALGIGENGHIAFNDPPVADFHDKETVKIVQLDEKCRQQQVNDGAFSSLSEVPKTALSLTIPALMSGEALFCIVPGKLKAQAVKDTLTGPVSESYPASVLRNHPNACLYLDRESAEYIL